MGVRRIIPRMAINVYNLDDTLVNITIRKVDSKGSVWVIHRDDIATLKKYTHDQIIVLDRHDHRIEVVLAGAVNANEPNFVTSWADTW